MPEVADLKRSLKIALTVTLTLCVLTCFLFWENCVIQTEEVAVVCPALPESFDGLRIAELADLHGRQFGEKNSRLLARLRAAEPDLICIDGDLFDENSDLSVLEPLLRGLCDIAPTYYVTGNHEWQLPRLKDILHTMESYGVCVLQNEYEVLERDGARLILAGVHDPCGPYDQKTPAELVAEIRRREGEESCIVMLAHRNDTLPMWASLGVELVLTGHCHGGIVRLPFLGGIFGSNRTLLPEYDAGLYRQADTALYVSRGLGYSQTHFRLFNRPHLPILTLHSGEIVNKS